MITFLHPYAFIWLALAVPIILFYLWRARRPQAQVVTGALWRKAIPLLHPRRAWQKQRWGVSLLVQLAILVVLVTALAEPVWRRPQRVVLVLDGTASMTAKNASGQTRFEEAADKARELVGNMGYVDSMAVLVAGDGIKIHSRMSHDRLQILATLDADALPEVGGTAPVDEAVEMAKSLIKAGTGGTFDPKTNHVILISDGCFPLADRVLKDETVRWIPVGEPLGNVHLETLSVERRDAAKPENAEIFAALKNFGEQSVKGTLTVTITKESGETDEQTLDVEIPAREKGGLLTRSVTVALPQAAKIHAQFQPADPSQNALTDDDSADAELAEAFTYRVLAVSWQEENTLLENALQALPGVQVETRVLKKNVHLTSKVLEEFAPEPFTLDESGVKRFQIVIYDRTLPPIKGEGLPFVCFAPPEDTELWTRSETVRDYVIMPWMDGLRSGISTAGVGFTGTHALVPNAGAADAQAWLFSQSALEVNENQNAAGEDENFAKQAKTVEMTELCWGLVPKTGPRCVLTACDLTQSDWILADDFPRFLQYSFDWLIDTPASKARLARGLETGWDPGESFTDSDLQLPAKPEKIFTFPAEDLIPFWSILALIVCGALAAEWYFYQRRWIE